MSSGNCVNQATAAASLAAMQARAESMARSGPHATGCPVRTARQKRAISSASASERSVTALPFGAGAPGDGARGGVDDVAGPARQLVVTLPGDDGGELGMHVTMLRD